MEDRKHTSHVAGAGASDVDQWCPDDFASSSNNRAQLPSSLANVIDSEISPRLFMLQTGDTTARTHVPSEDIRSSLLSSVEHFTSLIVAEATNDAYAMIEAPDSSDLQTIVIDTIRQIEGIRSTMTCFVAD